MYERSLRASMDEMCRCFAFALTVVMVSGCGRRNFNTDSGSEDGGGDAPLIEANYVFVTSTVHDGNLGGLAGADAICAAAAADAELPGTYVAWLSTSSVDAISRLAGARGWIRTDGRVVADRAIELTTTGPRIPISWTEHGIDLRTSSGPPVLTGTTAAGAATGDRCVDWTSANQLSRKDVGHLAAGSGRFTLHAQQSCDLADRLYCFGVDKNAAVPASVAPIGASLVFITSATWSPATGIATADQLCASEAGTAGLTGAFRAALTPTGATMASRFTTGRTYYRTDGVEVGRLLSDAVPGGFLNRRADGSHAGPSLAVTGGDPGMTGNDANNCTNWSTSAGAAQIGASSYAADNLFTDSGAPCSVSYPVYCLQD